MSVIIISKFLPRSLHSKGCLTYLQLSHEKRDALNKLYTNILLCKSFITFQKEKLGNKSTFHKNKHIMQS